MRTLKKLAVFLLILLLASLQFSQIPNVRGDPDPGWLSEFGYRKSHEIYNATGSGSDYAINIDVNYGSGSDSGSSVYCNSHCKNDFGDIRFTDDDGTTLLDYFLDFPSKVDGDSCSFWVEITDDLSSSNITMYLYYGNGGASTTSNGTNTFLFFDDFDGSAEPPEGWSEVQIGTLSWSDETANSQYKIYNYQDSSSQWHGNSIFKSATVPDTFCAYASVYVYCYGGVKPQHVSRLSVLNASSYIAYVYFSDAWTGSIGAKASWITGTAQSEGMNTRTANGLHEFQITSDGTNYKTWYNGAVYQTKAETSPIDEVSFYLPGGVTLSASNPSSEVNHIFVRKYVSPEPSHGAWGTEETMAFFLTFYFSSGGLFKVDNTTMTNGTMEEYVNGTITELMGIPQNESYVFTRFSWAAGNSTTNPYDFTVTANDTVWLIFGMAAARGEYLAIGIVGSLIFFPLLILIIWAILRRKH